MNNASSVYLEFKAAGGPSPEGTDTLALDWDETTGDYPLAFRVLAQRFARIVIVTVNDELTLERASRVLGRSSDAVSIRCCPEEAIIDVPAWKAKTCLEEGATIMFDDSPEVVRACHEIGVHAICVSERTWKFK